MIDALPNELRETVQAQFEMYDLVQREIDGRALNFYRTSSTPPIFPLLTMERDESPLVKITFAPNDNFGLVHGTLTAVKGRAFTLSFSKRIDGIQDAEAMVVQKVTQAWRSNFPQNS
ncbi:MULTISPECIES: hypothetical protein [unclassified Duganella]|uniref:hypothetical protein n=1 Tax=unclassified Duganella TaxID=2636909 RepID=UPI0011C15608|nr:MULTISPECIES: hypothetical protein [unclassified Duganella]